MNCLEHLEVTHLLQELYRVQEVTRLGIGMAVNCFERDQVVLWPLHLDWGENLLVEIGATHSQQTHSQ